MHRGNEASEERETERQGRWGRGLGVTQSLQTRALINESRKRWKKTHR